MKSNLYIPALTGVRAIAAYLVFFHHFNQAEFPFPLFRMLNEFHMGVTLFFVLSGFLICLRYYDNYEISGKWFRKYIKNRIARIYPMYLLLTLATFLYAWITKDNGIYNNFTSPIILLFLNVFFIRGFFDELKFTGISQGWTLTIEETFYFLAPFFFLRIKKDSKAIFYLPFLLLSLGVVLVMVFGNISFYGFFGNFKFMFLYTFLGRCIEFFIGMGLALIVLKKDDIISSKPLFTYLGLAVMIGAVYIMCIQPLDEKHPFGLYQPFGIFSNNVLLPIGVALFFYGLIKEKSILRYFLSTSWMQLLGKSSYIFYLIHLGFISKIVSDFSEITTDRFYAWLDAKEYWWLSAHINYTVVLLGMVFIILNLVSIILYKFIEDPMNIYIRKSALLTGKPPNKIHEDEKNTDNHTAYIRTSLFFNVYAMHICLPKKNAQGRGVEIILEAAKKKTAFNAKNPIRYRIIIKNNFTDDQEGTLVYKINDKEGETILTNSLDVKVNARKKIDAVFEVPLDQEGEYTLVANIEMTDHSETISRSFNYSGPPRKPKDRKKIPNPYDQNWSRANVDNEEVSTKESLIPETDKAIAEEEPAEVPEEEGEMIVQLKPNNRDGIFYDGKKIKYNVTITNKYKIKQEGTFKVIVKTDNGQSVGETVVPIKMQKKSVKKFTITMPEISSPGVYDFEAALNVSTYDDTTRHAFGYKINEINTPYHKPPDFDEFWQGTRDELAKIDPQYKITLDEGRSTYFHTVYKVEIQSLGNIPFYGWLSVPKPKGKYPVLVGFGGYKIELNPLYFDDFISFTINVRGIDKKIREQINPENREQLLVNIEDKNEYIYRGIYMDCIRAIEFVYAHGEQFGMDLKRVIAFGGSQGASLALIIAAMMPTKINTVVSNNPIFFDWVKSVEIGKVQKELSFPVKDMLEFEAKNPEITMDNIVKTLQYFEVQNFIPNVVCPVLYAVSLLDNFAPASTALAAFNKMPLETLRKSELYVFPNLGHEVPKSHDAFVGIWFLEKVVHPRKR